MSAESELQTLLANTGAVTAQLGDRIAADRIEQGAASPFLVYTRTGTESFTGLNDEVFERKVTLELQIWGDKRTTVDAAAAAVTAAIEAAHQAVLGRTSGYDGDLDMEAAILTVEWWEDMTP